MTIITVIHTNSSNTNNSIRQAVEAARVDGRADRRAAGPGRKPGSRTPSLVRLFSCLRSCLEVVFIICYLFISFVSRTPSFLIRLRSSVEASSSRAQKSPKPSFRTPSTRPELGTVSRTPKPWTRFGMRPPGTSNPVQQILSLLLPLLSSSSLLLLLLLSLLLSSTLVLLSLLLSSSLLLLLTITLVL